MMVAYKNQQTAMTLRELLTGICETAYLPEIEIQGLALDSRKVDTGYAFIALEGQIDHGLVYAQAAVSRGAVVVLCDAKFDQYCQQVLLQMMARVICVPIKNLSDRLSELAIKLYGPAHNELFIVGVTGTDGKTSVSHFIAQAMNRAYGSAAVIGTLGNGVLSNSVHAGQFDESTHTTPDIISLHEMLADYKQQGARHVSMEVSSHGLNQQRVSGIDFNVAILTNLSRDHLDYHGSIDAYKAAKKALFTDYVTAALVLNADDPFGRELYEEFKDSRNIWLYGLDKDGIKTPGQYAIAESIKTQSDGMSFVLNSSHGTAQISVQLMGEFNIYNVLACFCTLIQSGVNFNHAIKYIADLSTVPGRMELLHEAGKPSVVIDYAHTPQALSLALKNARKHVSGRLICVFGCGGDRDTGKRPLMAQSAEQFADLLIVTNDNPRSEDPQRIINDIKVGISDEKYLLVETDRRKAIEQAIATADEKDLVLIAGKGHENYQLMGNKKISFNDRQVAINCLESIK
ncbi:UDP-N-acetylmuramoylalanyl-D-glutamate--2,6-diaminopimelate ligase [hydrothermal vent metagenome]|uniref:UDP-N-acetylmuramoylalanyl-D-glutamate--2,6-diaminopimelate ligase n=1 Tax=hydrothermal vent metagenome TaxID=652676 RepID=A0A3B0WS33_9ZZZZ